MHGPQGWINNNWINSLDENLTFATYITVAPGINLMRTKRIKEKGTSLLQAIPRRDPYYTYFRSSRSPFVT